MLPPGSDAEFAQWRRDIEARLRALETHRRAPHTTLVEGSVNVTDAAGEDRAQFGYFDDPFTPSNPDMVGVNVLLEDGSGPRATLGSRLAGMADANGDFVFLTYEDQVGITQPEWGSGWFPLTYYATVSAAFEVVAQCSAPRLWHDVLIGRINAYCDAGTTGEMRVRELGSGIVTATKTLTTTPTTYILEWLHGRSIGVDVHPRFVLEGRRTGGTGSVRLRPDSNLGHVSSSIFSTADSDGWTP